MAEKKTYWLADGYGAKALATVVEERDRWLPRGWVESDEPTSGEMVWTRHAVTGGSAQFAADVVEQWRALGWEPAAPPEPVDLLHDAQLVDVQAAAPATTAPQSTGTRAASGNTSRES